MRPIRLPVRLPPVRLLAVALLTAAASLAAGTGASAPGSTTTTAYDDAGGSPPTLDSTVPASNGQVTVTSGLTAYDGGPPYDAYIPTDGRRDRPAIVMVHGGGWQGGDQTELAPYAMDAAANLGWAAFTVNYRLDGDDPAAWADELHDVQAAIRHITGSQAETFGIDPGNVVLLGDSAGANLVALVSHVGTADPVTGTAVGEDTDRSVALRAVALWSPPTDLAALTETTPGQAPAACGSDEACDFTWSGSAIVAYVGCEPSACPDRYRDASPIGQVSASTPPTYVANSTDELVPLDQVQQYVQQLETAGVDHRFDVVQGELHAAQLGPQVWPATSEFLADHLAASSDPSSATSSGGSASSGRTSGSGNRAWVVAGAAVLAVALLAGVALAVVEHRRSQRRD